MPNKYNPESEECLVCDHWYSCYHGVLHDNCPKNRISDREMLAVRMEVAVGICTKFPNLGPKFFSTTLITITSKEVIAANTLKELLRMEPVIYNVLKAYYA